MRCENAREVTKVKGEDVRALSQAGGWARARAGREDNDGEGGMAKVVKGGKRRTKKERRT